jgi:hypothetical protein
MSLLRDIERHRQRSKQSPSRFGRDAARDPRLVFDLRRGRGVGPRVQRRIETYLANRLPGGEAGK